MGFQNECWTEIELDSLDHGPGSNWAEKRRAKRQSGCGTERDGAEKAPISSLAERELNCELSAVS